jgi:hypothetical protein
MQIGLRAPHGGTKLLDWRRTQLARAGFPLPLASLIARDGRFDIHALIELAERGCDPEVATRIVAPIDDGGRAA